MYGVKMESFFNLDESAVLYDVIRWMLFQRYSVTVSVVSLSASSSSSRKTLLQICLWRVSYEEGG